MVELVLSIWRWLTRKEKSSVAIEGFDLLASSQREFNAQIIERLDTQSTRLDECDQDRSELRTAIGGLTIKVAECETDRTELRDSVEQLSQQINRHSIEIKSTLGITDDPKPPLRTTRKHFPDSEKSE